MGLSLEFCFILVLTFQFFLQILSVQSPNAFLKRFEPLKYNHREVNDLHRRIKRSTVDESPWLNIKFRSHNRRFHLRLKRDSSVFSTDHSLDFNGRPLKTNFVGPSGGSADPDSQVDMSFLYHGNLEGDPYSYVYGSVFDGIFEGEIMTGEGRRYHVEKAIKYFGPDHDKPYHSIIYEDSAIDYNKIKQRKRRAVLEEIWDQDFGSPKQYHPGCPLDGQLQKDMLKIQNSAVDLDFGLYERTDIEAAKLRYNKDSQDVKLWNGVNRSGTRTKRQSTRPVREDINGRYLWSVRTCSLYLQADQELYDHVFENEGARNPTRTREEILSLFSSHVKAVNHIYGDTSFGGVNGINFMVQRTSIFNGSSCINSGLASYESSGNQFCHKSVDVSNYLNLNSKKNHSSFCLAYSLTYRDFTGGTLGLAWVASPQPSTAGGVCEIYKEYSERRGRVWRSLNTGIITVVNYGNRVPPRVSQLTLAHEIGHNFGSPHDYPNYCQPGLPDGNYIMFASATSGDKKNNAKFSECSIKNISAVLSSVLAETPVDPQWVLRSPSGGKRNCFSERTTEFCGNQIKEPSEECDCGFTQADCDRMNDKCCFPHTLENGNTSKGCKKKSGVKCSPSEGVCCNPNTCEFRGSWEECRDAGECTKKQNCNGSAAACPAPPPKPDNTRCQENTKVCRSGNCNASICVISGLEECFISVGSAEDKCKLACMKNGKCRSSFELAELKPYYQEDTGWKGILLRPGSPCDTYNGYCDIFRKCRSVDSNGPLSRLKNLLFNSQTFETVAEWVQEHWWAVVLMGIGLVLLMALFIKCCAVHTPSTNPRKAPAQSIYETLRRPTTLIRRGHHSRGHGDHERHHRHHHHGRHRSRSHEGRRRRSNERRNFDDASGANGVSGPPPVNIPPPGHSGITVDPPPSYAAAVRRDPAVYGSGGEGGAQNLPGAPPRGHRKHRQNNPTNRTDVVEMRPKRT